MPVLTITEASIYLNTSPESIYRLLRLRRISRKSVGPTRVDTNEVGKLLVKRTAPDTPSNNLSSARRGWRDDG